MSKEIKLSKNFMIIVDNSDFQKVNKLKWFRIERHGISYAIREENRKKGSPKRDRILLHHFILNTNQREITIDHINGNGLDNRKENLRICTRTQNSQNRKLNCNNTSGYKGVSKSYGKWAVQINVNGKRLNLGRFANLLEAAKTYDEAAVKYHGEFARLNFPNKNKEGNKE